MLTYFLDRRDRRRDREEARQESAWQRQESERQRQESERQRQESERRHQETLIAMTNAIAAAVAARNGNGRTSAEQAETLDELRQRVRELEAEIARLRGDHADDCNGDGDALR